MAGDQVVEGGVVNISTSTSSSVIGSNARRRAVFDQRRNVIVRDTTMEADVRLDCRPAEMSVEDRLCRLQAHSFVAAVEQLG